MGTIRRELLDHFLIFSEPHLKQVLTEFVEYYNYRRPHQGIGQAIPIKAESPALALLSGNIMAFPVLGGLHHQYQRVA